MTGAVTLRSASHLLKVRGQFSSFFTARVWQAAFRILQRQKGEYKTITLVSDQHGALRQMVANATTPGRRPTLTIFPSLSQASSFRYKDYYIVAETIISFARPLLCAIATAMALTGPFFLLFFKTKNKVRVAAAATTRFVRPP